MEFTRGHESTWGGDQEEWFSYYVAFIIYPDLVALVSNWIDVEVQNRKFNWFVQKDGIDFNLYFSRSIFRFSFRFFSFFVFPLHRFGVVRDALVEGWYV